MRLRPIVSLFVFCGVLGFLGGHGADAATKNSLSFVQMLLSREAKLISVDESAIAKQNNAERILTLLEAILPTTGRQALQLRAEIAALRKNSVLLQAKIDSTTAQLLSTSNRLSFSLASLGNPSPFTQQAAANAVVIAALAARPPFGIPPVTGSQ